MNSCKVCGKPTNYTMCKTCSNKARSGPASPTWKGGISKDNYRYKKAQRERHPEHVRAREAVRKAIRAGTLIPQPCPHCGSLKVEAHHEDYSRPLEVKWYCRWYHRCVIHGDLVQAQRAGYAQAALL